jgi:V/A-type H+-transporting ATPase subunit D
MSQGPANKSALLQLRRQAEFLEQGQELLERKRELLNRLVQERLAQYHPLLNEAKAAVADAWRWLGMTQMRMSACELRQASLGAPPALRVSILPRRSLGVEFPALSVQRNPPQPVGLMGTDASFDESRLRLAQAAELLARLGAVETALTRLLAEQRKTQKRVNALKYQIIPRTRARIRQIEALLEEDERGALFQIKVLRERQEGAAA